MHTREADRVEAGWEVIARDGSPVGSVIAVNDGELSIQPTRNETAPVSVPANLIVEAHDGYVFVDQGLEDYGLAGSTDDASVPGSGPAVPTKELKVEDVRRVTGG